MSLWYGTISAGNTNSLLLSKNFSAEIILTKGIVIELVECFVTILIKYNETE